MLPNKLWMRNWYCYPVEDTGGGGLKPPQFLRVHNTAVHYILKGEYLHIRTWQHPSSPTPANLSTPLLSRAHWPRYAFVHTVKLANLIILWHSGLSVVLDFKLQTQRRCKQQTRVTVALHSEVVYHAPFREAHAREPCKLFQCISCAFVRKLTRGRNTSDRLGDFSACTVTRLRARNWQKKCCQISFVADRSRSHLAGDLPIIQLIYLVLLTLQGGQ